MLMCIQILATISVIQYGACSASYTNDDVWWYATMDNEQCCTTRGILSIIQQMVVLVSYKKIMFSFTQNRPYAVTYNRLRLILRLRNSFI